MSLHSSLMSLADEIRDDIMERADTASEIDDKINHLISAIENGSYNMNDIVSELEDIQKLIY